MGAWSRPSSIGRRGLRHSGEKVTVTYTIEELKDDGATVIITPVAGSLGPLPPASKGSLG